MNAHDIFNMAGRTVFVTGASSGIGCHAARLLASRGARVALAARRTTLVRTIAQEINASGGVACAVYLDIADASTVSRAFDEAETELGRPVDVLLNNAAILHAAKFLDQTSDSLSQVLDTNVKGSYMVAQEAARRMARHKSGCIVNVGSTAGLRAGSHMASYGASKAAMSQLGQIMALELASKGIRVNMLCPGNIQTDMQAHLEEKGFVEAMVKRTPLRRLGTVADLDGALLLLCSDAGRYMTGSTIVVDGGQTLSWM